MFNPKIKFNISARTLNLKCNRSGSGKDDDDDDGVMGAMQKLELSIKNYGGIQTSYGVVLAQEKREILFVAPLLRCCFAVLQSGAALNTHVLFFFFFSARCVGSLLRMGCFA